MADPAVPHVLNEYATRLIRIKARQLVRRRDLGPVDREDLQQELTAYLLRHAWRHDPTRAQINTFVDRVVISRAAMIIRNAKRRKRSGKPQSLEALLNDRDRAVGASLSDEDAGRRVGRSSESFSGREDAEAFAAAWATMDPDLRKLCRGLMTTSAAVVRRELGFSRRRMEKALANVRQHFQRYGFERF